MEVVVKPLSPQGEDWKARDFQREVVRKFKNSLNIVLTITRQVGKTEIAIILLYHFIFFYNKRKNPTAHVYMQDYQQVNSIYFERLLVWLKHIPPSLLKCKKAANNNSRGFIVLKRPWLDDAVTVYFMSHNVAQGSRGGTSDFIILDEAALCRKADWYGKISPMRDDTGGKAIVTSTYKGPDWYLELQEFAEKEEKKGSKFWSSILLDLEDMVIQGVRDREWADAKEAEMRAAGASDEFEREYMCNPYAGAEGEFPFGARFHENDVKMTPAPPLTPEKSVIFTALDIGKLEKMPSWDYVIDPLSGSPCVVGYKSGHKSFKSLAEHLYKNYSDFGRIVVFLPHDGDHYLPAVGMTQAEHFTLIIKQLGFSHKMIVYVLDKPQDKKVYMKYAIHNICDWGFKDCESVSIGMHNLRKFRFKRDSKTGMVLEYKQYDDVYAHTMDAACYMVHSLHHARRFVPRNGFMPVPSRTQRYYRRRRNYD